MQPRNYTIFDFHGICLVFILFYFWSYLLSAIRQRDTASNLIGWHASIACQREVEFLNREFQFFLKFWIQQYIFFNVCNFMVVPWMFMTKGKKRITVIR